MIVFSFLLSMTCFGGQSKFVIVIASYNNANYVDANMSRVLNQRYHPFRVIYIDDASTDGTDRILADIIQRSNTSDRVKVIRNTTRVGSSLANYYNAIHNEVADDEIVVIVDGDDKLFHAGVLNYLDGIYSSKERNIWMTYGLYKGMPSNIQGFCCDYPPLYRKHHAFRQWFYPPTHLKTFYAWLFKKVQKEDLMYEGEFFKMSGDLAMMLPMIEMAANHYQYISHILYEFNEDNPLSHHKMDEEFQLKMALYIRDLKPYAPLD